jgi:hypothetical protein
MTEFGRDESRPYTFSSRLPLATRRSPVLNLDPGSKTARVTRGAPDGAVRGTRSGGLCNQKGCPYRKQGRTHGSAPTKCLVRVSLLSAPLPQARRAGGEPFAGSPVALVPNCRRALPHRSITLLRPRLGQLAIPPLRFAGRLFQPVPRQGQALSLVLSLGQQRKDIWFSLKT